MLAYLGKESNVILPDNYNGQNYFIANYAFYDCLNLTSVTIPDGVVGIGESAFYGCSSLASVTIPNSVTSIGKDAFYNTAWYNNQSEGLVYAGKVAYKYKGTMTNNAIIKLTKGTLGIADNAFSDCRNLTSVTIPNGVIGIGESAFYGCTNLKTMAIGTGVQTIGSNQTTPTKTIWQTNTPPDGYSNLAGEINYVTNELYGSIGNTKIYKYLSSMFEVDGITYVPVNPSERTCDVIDCNYDSTLTDIIINETVFLKNISMNVKEVMPYAFYCNKYIKTVYFLNNGSIGNNSFNNCDALTTATLGDGIKSLENYAFSGCKQLKEIIIPDAVQTIGANCFDGCSSLPELTIPKSTTSIGDYAFQVCSNLTTIILPNFVTSIESYTFFRMLIIFMC